MLQIKLYTELVCARRASIIYSCIEMIMTGDRHRSSPAMITSLARATSARVCDLACKHDAHGTSRCRCRDRLRLLRGVRPLGSILRADRHRGQHVGRALEP